MIDNFFCAWIEDCKIIHFVIVAVIDLKESFVVKNLFWHLYIYFRFIYIIELIPCLICERSLGGDPCSLRSPDRATQPCSRLWAVQPWARAQMWQPIHLLRTIHIACNWFRLVALWSLIYTWDSSLNVFSMYSVVIWSVSTIGWSSVLLISEIIHAR